LLTTPVAALCYSCHGTAATGADTNVEDGVYLDRDAVTEAPAEGVADLGLKGGGFTNAIMDTSFSGTAASAATTSAHNHDDITAGTAWGNGAIGSGAGAAGFTLGCTDCHDPHGNGNYRILRPIPSDSGAAANVNVPDEATKDYTITDAGGQYFSEGYDLAAASTSAMSTQYVSLSDWCTQCHTRYLAAPDSGTSDSGDAIFAYRHMTADTFGEGGDCAKCHGSPFVTPPPITYNATYWNHDVECATCHVAHGTSAVMTGDGPYSGSVLWPDGAAAPNGDARSSLLRVDNRGVCQACHDKPGTSAPAP
jgi:hypothetical protein